MHEPAILPYNKTRSEAIARPRCSPSGGVRVRRSLLRYGERHCLGMSGKPLWLASTNST